jgi:imidazole glycerol phosphate synthase glutamine amidotransferase subunit
VSYAAVDLKLRVRRVGDLQAELMPDFFDGFAQAVRGNVHVKVLYGRSSHHHVEAVFKAFARALRVAVARDRGWRACCRPRRGCCDGRAAGLWRGQPGIGAQGAGGRRRGGAHRRRRGRISRAPPRWSSPASATSVATAAIDADTRTAVRAAIDEGRPVLGICLGMQWLFEGSDEAPEIPGRGLGIFHGTCFRLPSNAALKVPHVGWNRLRIERAGRLLEGLDEGAYAYFTHSYAAPPTAATSAIATHGAEFAAAVERDLVFGVQFHPEKSGDAGLRILCNFVEIARAR